MIDRFWSDGDALLDADLVDRRDPAQQRPEAAGARVVRADELVGALAGGAVAGDGRRHGLRVYPALSSRQPGLAPGAVLRRGGQARLALTRKCVNQSRTWARFSARRNGDAGAGQLVRSRRGRA